MVSPAATKPDPNKTTPPHVAPPKPDPHAPTPRLSPAMAAIAKGRGRPNPQMGDQLPLHVDGKGEYSFFVVEQVGAGGQGVVVLADSNDGLREALDVETKLGIGPAQPFVMKVGSEIRAEAARVPVGPPPKKNVAQLMVAGETIIGGKRFEVAIGRYYGRGSIAHEIDRSLERVNGQVVRGMPVDQAANVASAALHGLTHLHDAGKVHGDVKPSNMLAVRLPSGDTSAHLTDFGSAFDATDPPIGGTATTIGFASHRLLTNEGPFGARDDLYAVGVSLAHMIRGTDQSLVSRTIENASPWKGGGDEDARRLLSQLQPTYLRTGHVAMDHVVARMISPDSRDAGFDGVDAMACLYPMMSKGAREPEKEQDRVHDDAMLGRLADRTLHRLDPNDPLYDPGLVPLFAEAGHHLAATSHLPLEQRQDLRHAAMAAEEACVAGPADAAAQRWVERAKRDNEARLTMAESMRDRAKPSMQLDDAHRQPIRPARAPKNPVHLPDRGP